MSHQIMRFIVFPSFESKNMELPNLHDLIGDSDIDVISGPTDSGIYLIEGESSTIEIFKYIAYPYYILMEDFDPPTVH